MLTPEDQRQALRRVRAHLEDGGRLVLDLFNPSIPFLGDPVWGSYPIAEPEFAMPDGRRVTRSYRVLRRDYFNQIQHVEFIVDVAHPDGRAEHRSRGIPDALPVPLRGRVPAGVRRLPRGGVYGDYDRTPYGENYPGELLLVAEAGRRMKRDGSRLTPARYLLPA